MTLFGSYLARIVFIRPKNLIVPTGWRRWDWSEDFPFFCYISLKGLEGESASSCLHVPAWSSFLSIFCIKKCKRNDQLIPFFNEVRGLMEVGAKIHGNTMAQEVTFFAVNQQAGKSPLPQWKDKDRNLIRPRTNHSETFVHFNQVSINVLEM